MRGNPEHLVSPSTPSHAADLRPGRLGTLSTRDETANFGSQNSGLLKPGQNFLGLDPYKARSFRDM